MLGLALVAFAARKHARDRSSSEPAAEPGWLTKLDKMGPVVAFAFGTFMINVVFVVDAGMRIAAADPGTSSATVAIVFYTVLSTASLIAVLVVYFSDRAARRGPPRPDARVDRAQQLERDQRDARGRRHLPGVEGRDRADRVAAPGRGARPPAVSLS